jgi:methylthioribose-1-phosphate isomerase
MLAQGRHYRTIWLKQDDPGVVQIIDQRYLPHRFVTEDLANVDDMAVAIADMHLRGAGLIGAAAGYGMYLAARVAPKSSPEAFRAALERDAATLIATRPTAVNLEWAVKRALAAIAAAGYDPELGVRAALDTAAAIADEDADFCRRIGENGKSLIQEISRRKEGAPVNILTHCNAGWLAFVDYGSATAPIYAAFEEGIPVHVWVDETRPRNQGARLTAWEMVQEGVPHTVIADNVGGHLMQHGLVDLVIVGADRVAYTGDVANKVGTYLKALAAHDNGVPFYVALPSSTFDWQLRDGVRDIPIEQRDGTEVRLIEGLHGDELVEVLLTPEESPAANYAFDVTPARLVTGLITERGICAASEEAVLSLYPEKRK